MTGTPDFLDPGLQDDSSQREILAFLRTLTPQYSPVWPDGHHKEMALGVLLIARGVQIKESGLGLQVSDGSRRPWHRMAHKDVTKELGP